MIKAQKIRCCTCDGTGMVEVVAGDGRGNRSKEVQPDETA